MHYASEQAMGNRQLAKKTTTPTAVEDPVGGRGSRISIIRAKFWPSTLN